MRRIATCLFLFLITNSALLQAQPAIAPDEGVRHIDWTDAGKMIGKTVYVSGEIVGVGSSGRVNFLNFDHERPPAFVGIVFSDNLPNFPGNLKDLYENKIVRIRGRIITYQDRPQVVVTNADQIEVLDKLPETTPVGAKPRTTLTPSKDELVIATFNVLNLFDDVDDPYTADEGTPPKPREEMENLAKTIRKVNADILALQEVENRGYLERFNEVFLSDMGYEHVVLFEGNDQRGIDVCLLSRVPVGPVTSHRHLRFEGPDGVMRRFNRDIIAITLEPPGAEPLEAWVVHLKSNSGGREFAEPVRLAEAAQLRRLLDEKLVAEPDARIVLLGDFNDTRDSKTMNIILGEGSQAMWSPEAQETEDSVPDPNNPPRPPIDFILLSPAMAKLYVEDSCKVIRAPVEVDGSDHDPVFATFRLK